MTTTGNLDRARAYLAKLPPAISGAGGHDACFTAACTLVRFGLSSSEAWSLLSEYNQRCKPPWSERELEHKLSEAYRVAKSDYRFEKGNRFPFEQPKQKIDPTTAVENWLKGFRCDEVDLWEASPLRPPDDWTQDACILLEHLHHPGELINYVTAYRIDTKADGTQKAVPCHEGKTVERSALIDRFREGMPKSEAGGWLRMNPLDGQGVADNNVTAYRFALLECDAVPIELQMPLLARLPLPIAAILTSGGKSLHAWVRVDASTIAEYKSAVERMLNLLVRFGIDRKNGNPSRLSRLPGVLRTIGADGSDGANRQRLLYLNPNPVQKRILC